LDEILNTPAIPTRIQASLEGTESWSVGIQDLYLLNRVTLSGDYRQSFEQPQDHQFGSSLRYFLAPVGSVFNLAPQVGYRRLEQSSRALSGLQYGAYAVFALSPRSADLTASYSLLDASQNREGWATLADITAAYALSPSTRVAARFSWQNSTISKESRFGFVLEWTP
jgi:hypothetical protein